MVCGLVSCVVWRWFAVPLACSLSSDVLSLGYFLLSCWMHCFLGPSLSWCTDLLVLSSFLRSDDSPLEMPPSALVICHSPMFSRSICQLLICCRSICFGPICCHHVSCCCSAYTYSTNPLSLDGGLPSCYTMTLSSLLLRLLLRTLGCGISDCP